MAHDDFEIAIEQRLCGALDAAGAQRLDEHLSGCPECRAYEARARQEDGGRKAMFGQEVSAVDLERIGHRAQKIVVRGRRLQWIMPLSYLLFMGGMAVVLLVVSHNRDAALFCAGMGVVGALLWGYLTRRAQRRHLTVLATQGPLALQRAELDRKIRYQRIAALSYVGVVFPITLTSFLLWDKRPLERVGGVVVMLSALLFGLLTWLRDLPRLRRERDELK